MPSIGACRAGLSKMQDAVITVVPQRVIPNVPNPQQKVPEPEQIIRKPVPSEQLPGAPVLNIPLYPEENLWYNSVSLFTTNWDLPLDISGVSTALNNNPNAVPPERSEGLFDAKTFGALEDGKWYLHVRFKNDIGWGTTTTHRTIAIDTQPPLGFDVQVLEGELTDHPAPTLQFTTSDALSGLKEYQIQINDGDFIRIPVADFSGSFTLPLQTPGEKRISVKAVDLAENSIENHVDIEILPIDPPTITFVTEELFSDEKQGLTVQGTALPDTDVLLEVQNVLREGRGEVVAKNTARSNEMGNWEFTFNQPFRNGQYIVSAQSRDARGALSLIVESPVVLVKAKPIIHIGALHLGKVGALIVLLLVIAGGFGGGIWFNTKRQNKRALRLMIVKTDMAKVFQLILNDIKRLQMAIDIPNKPKEEFTIKKLKETIKKMEGYLKKEMDRLK